MWIGKACKICLDNKYSKIGKMRERLFHAWRSFHFDKSTKTIDAYVMHIRQVTALLGYGEPQISEVFKNTLPTRLYWILFPKENLWQLVETVKRILTKEKIDRQLAGQSSSNPFMSARDSYNKSVAFNTQEGLEDKIDKLTAMMYKLAARDNKGNRLFKPQVDQSKWGGQSRSFHDSYNHDRGNYQNKYRSNSRDRKSQFKRQGRGRLGYEQNYKRGNFRSNTRSYHIFVHADMAAINFLLMNFQRFYYIYAIFFHTFLY